MTVQLKPRGRWLPCTVVEERDDIVRVLVRGRFYWVRPEQVRA